MGDDSNITKPDLDLVGKNVCEVPKPAAILDIARVRRHCSAMLDAVHNLGIGFRAHVKTHKTVQLTSLQLGGDSDSDSDLSSSSNKKNDAKIIVSTVAEIEHLLPLLEKYVRDGRRVNVLYGIPLPPSQVSRLAKLARQLGPESIALMIDHPSQLGAVRLFHEQAGFAAGIYIKVDTGYHRAGLPPASLNKGGLIQELSRLEEQGKIFLIGLYSHSSLSYVGKKPEDAFASLVGEVKGCVDALVELRRGGYYNGSSGSGRRIINISVGASPQALALQNNLASTSTSSSSSSGSSSSSEQLQGLLRTFASGEIEGIKASLEIHAGVYTTLDLQQLATKSRESFRSYEDEIALSIAAEVVSVYNDGERAQPEALVAVGTLGLGREPCPGYRGWGVVSSRNIRSSLLQEDLARRRRRLIVDRISQEHAIVAWERLENEGDSAAAAGAASLPPIPLEVGQTVFIYPNHACIAGAMYKSYLVVDSSSQGNQDQVVIDVWERCSGW